MIYQIGIGEYDNCYIITGGLTGLTSFEPVLVNGDSEACSIIIDKKDDSIFSPWVKQSLKVSLVKENETDYAEIISGNDNETYGILIEGGELELKGADITITSGGILKFIGTLALESYSEQYKEVSIVSFTFNDRIGVLSDEIFFIFEQILPFTTILGSLLKSIICSNKIYIEWPYNLSSDSDPENVLLDIISLNNEKKSDVLETILTDFGLQLKVDFELNSSSKLLDCGAIKIISIVNIAEQNISYWEKTLTEEIVHDGTYYNYTGISVDPEIIKSRYLLGSTNIPLIDHDATLELERVATSIIAKNTIVKSGNLVWGGEYNNDLTIDEGSSKRYYPFGYISTQSSPYDLRPQLLALLDADNLHDLYSPIVSIAEDAVLISGQNSTTKRAIVLPQIRVSAEDFGALYVGFGLEVEMTAYGLFDPAYSPKLYLCMLAKFGGNYYYSNNASWSLFTDQSQLKNGLLINLDNNTDVSSFDMISFLQSESPPITMLPVIVCSEFNAIAAIKTIKIFRTFYKSEMAAIPDTITLTTTLSGNNRKNIELESTFISKPNIFGSKQVVSNLIYDSTFESPSVISYKSLSQTLLAHLSDQYGWQYDGNRWNVNGTCKVVDGSMNLMGQFGLEDKVLTLISGEYNAKRKTLKGKWGQVLEVGVNKYRLLQDNFVPFTWDDGNYIMLN